MSKYYCYTCNQVYDIDDIEVVGRREFGAPEDCYPGDPVCGHCGNDDYTEDAWEAVEDLIIKPSPPTVTVGADAVIHEKRGDQIG